MENNTGKLISQDELDALPFTVCEKYERISRHFVGGAPVRLGINEDGKPIFKAKDTGIAFMCDGCEKLVMQIDADLFIVIDKGMQIPTICPYCGHKCKIGKKLLQTANVDPIMRKIMDKCPPEALAKIR